MMNRKGDHVGSRRGDSDKKLVDGDLWVNILTWVG